MRKTITRKNHLLKQAKNDYISYKPFFWHNAIEGEISGGFPVNNKKLHDNQGNKLAIDIVNVTSHNMMLEGGSASTVALERFRNLVVPYGFMLNNEISKPHKKYIEHFDEEIIDEQKFNSLFSPLMVNQTISKRTTSRSKPSTRKNKTN